MSVILVSGISGKKAKKLRVHSIESGGEEYNESFVSAGAERSGGVARWRRATRARDAAAAAPSGAPALLLYQCVLIRSIGRFVTHVHNPDMEGE